MTGSERDKAKDHGGFVGGLLNGGRRKVENVQFRSIISLDGDYLPAEFIDEFELPYEAVMYSTHSHTPENPRVRIVIPLSRDVTPEEYVAVARYTVADIGIDYFDPCSFRINQLMYLPSTPKDGEFVYKEVHGDWLDPDEVLKAHPDWKDPTTLPRGTNEKPVFGGKKVEDPLEKEGVVGAFCRTYFPIEKVIEEYLPDVYEEAANGRYCHKGSHSIAGVVLIEDKFVYSYHAKDPAGMRLCNAFDLVRIHKFGDTDKSFKEMCDFALKDATVKKQYVKDKQEQAKIEFLEEPDDWMSKLDVNPKTGEYINNLGNLMLILENDPNLKGIVFNQLADGMEIKEEVPWKHPSKFWREADDKQLVAYVYKSYGHFSKCHYDIAVGKVVDDRLYHPVREMFEALPDWDGVPRIETLFIDYLGAEDNEYVRAITRKAFCAAYMRVYEPGIKYDTMLVLVGEQGQGKSTLIAKMGKEWYSDSLNFSDMHDKTAAEKLQGYWLIEIGELAGIKKMEVEKSKAFISRQDDKYRAAYGKRVETHPRQCVFFGTTNKKDGYLRDITGNRRFWNMFVSGKGKYTPWDLTDDCVDQIWAEVKTKARDEKLFLPPHLEEVARDEQRKAMEPDDREGLVRDFLEMKLTDEWESLSPLARNMHFKARFNSDFKEGSIERQTVSNYEIWCECFGNELSQIQPKNSYEIAAIMGKIEGWSKTDRMLIRNPYGKQRVYERENTSNCR